MDEHKEKSHSSPPKVMVNWIIKLDTFLHMVVAAVLILSCFAITWFAFKSLFPISRASVIQVINDMLLVLIILELLWTVIRFLKKKRFILGPYISIGIIAAVRRILLIEAQTSSMKHVPVEKLYEIGLSALVVLVLIIAYYISYKTPDEE